jgi:hypothetical protein
MTVAKHVGAPSDVFVDGSFWNLVQGEAARFLFRSGDLTTAEVLGSRRKPGTPIGVFGSNAILCTHYMIW